MDYLVPSFTVVPTLTLLPSKCPKNKRKTVKGFVFGGLGILLLKKHTADNISNTVDAVDYEPESKTETLTKIYIRFRREAMTHLTHGCRGMVGTSGKFEAHQEDFVAMLSQFDNI